MSAFRPSALLLVLCALPALCAAQAIPTSATSSFERLDTNDDGLVDKSEYDSSAMFREIDANHNSRISADELDAVLGPQQDGTLSSAERISVADINDDGELTDEELRRAAEMRFSWLDSNGDGKLELPEMKSGFGIRAPQQY